MAASLTDKFRKGAPFFQTTLSGSISDSDTTLTLASATGLPTDTAIDFVIDRIDQNGELLDPSLREVVTGTVSGTTVTTDATRRGLDNTTAQAHTAGAVVEVNFTSDTWNDHIDGVLTSLNQDGTIKDDAVDTAQIADSAVTTAKIATGAVTTPKIKPTTGIFADTGSADRAHTSTTYADQVTILSHTAGATNERVFIDVSGVWFVSTNAGYITIAATGTGVTVQMTSEVRTASTTAQPFMIHAVIDVTAGNTATIKIQTKIVVSGTVTLANSANGISKAKYVAYNNT